MNRQESYASYDVAGTPAAAAPQGSRAWGILLSASIALIVCIRFFTDTLQVLPGLAQYVDVPILILLVFCSLLHVIRYGYRRTNSGFGIIVYFFVLISLASTLANSSRTELLPAAMFIFNFAAPLVFALVTIQAGLGRDDVRLVLRTFFWLGALQIVIGLLYDVPIFLVTHEPDLVSGTFGRNPYQFTYFLGLWLLYLLSGTIVGSTSVQRRQIIAVGLAAIAIFGLFYAAQYRAMLIFFTTAILLTLWVSPGRISKRVMITAMLSTVSVVTLIVVGTSFPNLKLLQVFDLLKDRSPILQSGKIQAVENVVKMYGEIPHTTALGSGPATFSSRAYIVFSSKPRAEKEAVGVLVVQLRGGELYRTDVAREYVDTIRSTPIQGGTTASSPMSSYTSLAAEVGVLGFFAYLAAYLAALVHSFRRLRSSAKTGDSLSFRVAFTCLGGLLLLLIQALFDNWLETTRVAIPLWGLVGLLYALDQTSPAASKSAMHADASDSSS